MATTGNHSTRRSRRHLLRRSSRRPSRWPPPPPPPPPRLVIPLVLLLPMSPLRLLQCVPFPWLLPPSKPSPSSGSPAHPQHLPRDAQQQKQKHANVQHPSLCSHSEQPPVEKRRSVTMPFTAPRTSPIPPRLPPSLTFALPPSLPLRTLLVPHPSLSPLSSQGTPPLPSPTFPPLPSPLLSPHSSLLTPPSSLLPPPSSPLPPPSSLLPPLLPGFTRLSSRPSPSSLSKLPPPNPQPIAFAQLNLPLLFPLQGSLSYRLPGRSPSPSSHRLSKTSNTRTTSSQGDTRP